MTTALLFAGQGAQAVGMGRGFDRALFDRASKVLGYDLARLCWEGPQEELDRTDRSQPALLVAAYAAFEAHRAKHAAPPAAFAGLSLGEYTALAAAGALAFEDAVRLVQVRGEAMQAACDAQPSGMASVLGADRTAVEKALAAAKDLGPVVIANLNAPGHIVISGAKAALERASDECRKLGARRVLPLRVAGAYHSPLMEPARARLDAALRTVAIRNPAAPVYSNVTASPVTDPEEIRRLLARQIVSPVLWEDSIRAMAAAGATRFVEFGPGKVLAGLVRKILPEAETLAVEKPEDIP